jgi:fructan beta-fructosidase
LEPKDGKVSIRVLLDRPMIEIIGNDGERFVTSPRVKPGPDEIPEVRAFARGGKATLLKLEVNELESIWKDKK